MAEFINHNSFILLSVIVLLVAAGIMVRRGVEIKRLVPFGVLVVLIAVAFFTMRPAAGTDASTADITAQIGGGKAVLLEFQSQN
jgi:hypothetical protein